jgi:peptidylprolyl isomerase
MAQGFDRRWLILGSFVLVVGGIVAAVLISRGGGGGATASGCEKPPGPVATKAKKTRPTVTVPNCTPPSSLVVNELERGTGAEAKSGDKVTVQYAGVGFESGKEFDASWNRGEPFKFTLGAGMVIPGWDEGVEGMKVGGRRELIIPPELGYGSTGSPPSIGPNETLIFVIDLLAIR